MQSGTWHSVLALLAAIFYLMIVLVCSGFHLSRPAGTALLTGYLGYLVYRSNGVDMNPIAMVQSKCFEPVTR